MLFATTGLMLLAACAGGTPPKVNIGLPASYSVAPTTTPATPTDAIAIETLDKWWLLFGDAQLSMLVERALHNGFSIREAQAKLAEARAIRSTALNGFAPQGNLKMSAEHKRSYDQRGSSGDTGTSIPGTESLLSGITGVGAVRTANLSFPVSWEVDLLNRRGATRQAADADFAAARFNAEATSATLAADVARALFQARGLAAQRDDALATLDIQQRLQTILQRRVAIGVAPRSEVDRIEADVALAAAQADDASAALDAAKRALLVLLGDGTVPLSTMAIAAPASQPPAFPSLLPSQLLARRPDVREAEARLLSASGNRELARLALFPKLTLEPGVGITYQKGGFDIFNLFWKIGAGLAMPVLDRPRLLGELRAQDARTQGAVVAYERAVQTAFSEADQALIRLAADRRRVDRLEQGARSAGRAFDAATIRYQRGFSDLQDLLDAERTLRSARTALTTARTDVLLRAVQGFQAMGGGWNSDKQG